MEEIKRKKHGRKGKHPKVKRLPGELVQGTADSVKMRAVTQFRESVEGDRRSNYGGDEIEDAALYAGWVMKRGAEAFVRTHMAELASMRREAAEPPLYDLPFDLTVSSETAQPTPLPALLPNVPDGTIAEPAAPLELPAPESAGEKPKKRRKNPASESFPVENSVEKKEESWTPAYRDVPTENRNSAKPQKSGEAASDTPVREYKNSPEGKNRDTSHVRHVDRDVKPSKDAETDAVGARRIVKEKAAVSAEHPAQINEAGRQKFVREKGRQAARQHEVLTPENHTAYAHPEARSTVGGEHSVPKTQVYPAIRTRNSEVPGQDVPPKQMKQQSAGIAEQGKRELIREHGQQTTAQRMNIGSSIHDSTVIPSDTRAETLPQNQPQTRRVAAQTAGASVHHPAPTNADKPPQTAVQGEQNAIRERTVKIAEKPTISDRESGPKIKTAPSYIDGESAVKTVRQDRVTDAKRGPARTDSQSGQELIREHTEVFPKGEESHPKIKQFSDRTGIELQPHHPKQERTQVKTKTVSVPQEKPSGAEQLPRIAERGRDLPVRERTGNRQVSIKTNAVYIEGWTPATEAVPHQINEAVSGEIPKELRKTVRTREGLIQGPEPLSEAVLTGANTAEAQPYIQGHSVQNTRESAVPAGTEQRAPDIKTRTAYASKEAVLSTDQTGQTVEPGREKFLREQKRKAAVKRAAERRMQVRNARLYGEEMTSEAAGNSAVEQAQGIRTKEAWLQQQGKDRLKERAGWNRPGEKSMIQKDAGHIPFRAGGTNETPIIRSTGGEKLLPTAPQNELPTGGVKTRTSPVRFIREKRKASERVVREVAEGGRKAVKTVRPVAVKEAGKASGKAVKTAGRTARKAVKTAETASAQMMRNAKRAAQSAAKTKAVREASAHAVKHGTKTVQDAAQAVGAAAKAAAASLQSLIAGLSAGGGVVLVVLIVICLLGLLVATPFGLFLSGQLGVGDNIQTAVSQLAGEYNTKVQEIQDDTPHDELDIAEDIPSSMMNNWRNVLSVYAVRVTTDELSATEVVTLTEEKLDILRETFWDMNQLHYRTTSRTVYSGEDDDEGTTIVTLHISATTKNAEEMAEEYGFDDRQKGLLEELLSSEYDELFDTLLGSNPALVPGNLDGVLIPGNVSEVRQQVIATGSQLLGQVHYFWGGKSLVLGWDSRWGTPKRVWAAGSPSTGTVRPYGLDCSGFVDWVFYNVSGGTYVIGHGGGASMQHRHCTTIPWSQAQPGDLAFYPGDSHVGIIVGYDDAGNVKIMHCASGSSNGVVITGKIGFVSAAIPDFYAESGTH